MLALVGTLLSRASFRSLWGVMELLPAPAGIYPGTRPTDRPPIGGTNWGAHPCANFDMYRASEWDLGLSPAEQTQLQAVLDGAAAFHRDLAAAHQALTADQRGRMLMIAGVGYKTLFRLEYPTGLLKSWREMTKVTARVPGDPHREGDGRVPLASATLPGVTMRYARGVHGELTNIPAVYADTFRWLNELKTGGLDLPQTPAQALASHLATSSVSQAPNLDGSVRADKHGDDPGYLNVDEPDAATLSRYVDQLNAGTLPDFNTAKLL
jgi:hypothetical protein